MLYYRMVDQMTLLTIHRPRLVDIDKLTEEQRETLSIVTLIRRPDAEMRREFAKLRAEYLKKKSE